MARILGILNLHNEIDLGDITKNRSLAALTFLGRYSFCDIPLSNFGNSGINSSAILVKNNIRSIIKHIDDVKGYCSNAKLGSLFMLYNEQYASDELYNTDINNLLNNRWILEENDFKYVIIAPTHIIYRMNYQDVIKKHEQSKSEITVCYKKINDGKNNFINADCFYIDENHHLRKIYSNKGVENQINVSLETYIINKDKLLEMLDFASHTSSLFTIKDVLNYVASTFEISSYEYNGYLRRIDSLSKYLESSLELLDLDILPDLIDKNWPIYTKTHDTPPAKYLNDSVVKNSFISNGAIISGKVENSIICRNVKISKNCHIKNSIILSDTYISENSILDHVIIDKNAKVIYKKELHGTKKKPLYVKQGDTI